MKRWTPKDAVARTRRNVDGAVERLRAVALIWGDIDQSFIDRTEELITELQEFADDVRDSVKQRLDAGEHVGI